MNTEAILSRAECANTDLRARRAINRAFRKADNSHLWPVCGRFNVTDRAIRRVQKMEREGFGALTPVEYVYALDAEIARIVNAEA